jgi:hypothetical protein
MTHRVAWAALALVALAGCPPEVPPDTDSDPIVLVGPELVHDAVVGPVDANVAVPITVGATDDDGVFQVSVGYRTTGEAAYETLFLALGDDGLWTGEIPANQVQAPGLEYYVHAEDGSDFRVPTELPEGGADAPLEVEVQVLGAAIPWTEDVEGGAEALTLFELGWLEVSLGFPGSAWELTRTRANGGTYSLLHRKSAEGVGTIDDWLVSPALNLPEGGAYQVSWHEYAIGADLADHSVWYSVGSPDPSVGDFVLITDVVAPPEGAWGRSPVVELPAAATGRAVYLAWRYEGAAADAWYVDDFAVGPLGADLQLDALEFTRVDPGASTSLSLHLRNGTDVAAEDVVLSATSPGGEIVDDVTIDVAAGASVVSEVEFAVDAAWPDNSRLPITLTATGPDGAWTWEQSIVVGDAPRGRVSIDTEVQGLIQVAVGSGDPNAPAVRIPVTSQIYPAGEHVLTVDLLDAASTLPPGAGDNRWWVEVLSGSEATLLAYEIDHDGITHRATRLGGIPRDAVTRYFLPAPPVPTLRDASTEPATLTPGDDARWFVSLRNDGSPTTGRTTVRAVSRDPNVVIVDGPEELDAAAWQPGISTQVAFDVQILDTKTDARPAPIDLVIEDEFETWTVRTSLAVPWAVLQVMGVVVDDFSDGDDDGLLEDGEQVNLDVSLGNIGTRSTDGAVACTLRQQGGDVTATLVDATGSFSALDPREVDAEDDFEIRVGTAETGDRLPFVLDCLDSTGEFAVGFELVIGDKPWISMTVAFDPLGDALGDGAFDLVSGQFRAQRGYLQLRLDSAAPFDPDTAFIEAWMESPGASYTYYQVVAQSGAGSLRGYRFGFESLNPGPTVFTVDEDTLQIDVPIATMRLSANQVRAGFAAGFCGDPTYFCDHFPNGWGDPYNVGLNTALWLPLSW